MAKKYLLYIHDRRFDDEKKKSELVNNLLERHYQDTVGGKTQEQVLEIIKTKQDAIRAVKPLMDDSPWSGPLFRDKKKSKL